MCLGIPGQLTEIFVEETLRMGKVRFSGVLRSVCLELVPDAVCGDFVLVHVGFALSRIGAEEAERLTALLDELARSEQAFATRPPGDA
ncbi:MAG TPA: HypC/HybG/HupF family hydrogenase formation chaperone [Polyangiaceae bacterium]|jgi:hydrogenase expression/formation protein HypC